MKVCIIGHTERNYLPYVEKYIRFFEENGVEYDTIFWNREIDPTDPSNQNLDFCEQPQSGVFQKIASYLRFRKHVLRILQAGNYDKLIVLTTLPALFLRGYLTKQYKGRYLFDIRDYSMERFAPYRRLVDHLIQNSELTTISSKGFLDFLSPSENIIMNHNIGDWADTETMEPLKEKQVINIGFIGGIRYFDENACLIDKLKNTFRYQLWYIGQPHEDCDLPGYCAKNGVTNVSFVGKFDNSQKPELYRGIDLINSIYGNDSPEVTTALPNRLYEACLFKKPIISSKGTYLGEVIQKYCLGLVVDEETDDILSLLNDYIDQFDPDAFCRGCEQFLALVKEDEDRLYRELHQFIRT